MQILTYNNVLFMIGKVEKGIWENDPSRETYRITNSNGVFYAVTEGFMPYEVGEIPSDVEPEKWCYTQEKGFYKNQDYVEYVPVEQRIDEIETQNLEILYQVCLLQLGISEEDINSSEQEVK